MGSEMCIRDRYNCGVLAGLEVATAVWYWALSEFKNFLREENKKKLEKVIEIIDKYIDIVRNEKIALLEEVERGAIDRVALINEIKKL